jgi:4-amino-4-deoxy-L-arabinose transferase-like glycosyltransferase
VRLVSLFFGFLLLGGIYWIGALLGGRRLGFLSLLLLGLSYPFFYSAHLARPDVIAAALGYLAIAMYLHDRARRRGWVGLATGLTLGLAFEIHPNSAIFIVAILVLYLWDLRLGILRSAQFYGYIAGGLLGAGVYAALHVLPYPQTFLEFNRYSFNATHTPPLFTLDISILLASLAETATFLAVALLLLLPVVVLGVFWLISRRSPADRTLLVLAGALLGSYALLVQLKAGYYAIFLAPVLLLTAAHYLLHALETPWSGRWTDYLGRLAWGLTLAAIAMNLWTLRQDNYPRYLANQSQVDALVNAGDTVLGPQVYWFGLSDHPYLYMEQLAYYRHYHPQTSLEDALKHFRPSVFIEDSHLRGYMEGSALDESSLFGYLALDRSELERILNKYARPVAEFDSGIFGETRLYRFDWGN